MVHSNESCIAGEDPGADGSERRVHGVVSGFGPRLHGGEHPGCGSHRGRPERTTVGQRTVTTDERDTGGGVIHKRAAAAVAATKTPAISKPAAPKATTTQPTAAQPAAAAVASSS